jgi:twinkle protein
MKKLIETKVENMRDVFLAMAEDRLKPPQSIKLPGWNFFNQVTGGFRPNEFTILCGSTGIGKTTFLANMSMQLMLADAKQLIMSVETGARDYMARIASVFAEKDINEFDLVEKQFFVDLITAHQKHIVGNTTFFSLYEDRVSVEQIMQDIEHAHKTYGVQIVFIDNLNYLLEVTSAQESIVEMDRVIHSLIVFCKRIPVHIVMVMHSRKPENGKGTDFGRVENEFQIKGSSTAVQEAQNVFLLNRPKKEDVENERRKFSDRELKIAKMRRRGKYVGCEIIFSNSNTRYTEHSVNDVFGCLGGNRSGGNDTVGSLQVPTNRTPRYRGGGNKMGDWHKDD